MVVTQENTMVDFTAHKTLLLVKHKLYLGKLFTLILLYLPVSKIQTRKSFSVVVFLYIFFCLKQVKFYTVNKVKVLNSMKKNC